MTGPPSGSLRSVLVVGAGLAGHASAQALRDNGFDGVIDVIGDEPDRPYDRTPLTKAFLSGAVGADQLFLEPPDESLGARWHLGVRAARLDVSQRSVVTADGRRFAADAVLIACGSRARRMPGAPAGVHTVRTLSDAAALRAALVPGIRLVVIGAGFIGAEIASTARGLGIDVTVLEAAATPLAGPLGPAMGSVVAGLHERNGARLRCGVPVSGFIGGDRVTGIRLADGSEVPADVVVVGIGATPAVEWLASSGLDISDGVVCTSTGATTVPGLHAVGDCSAWFDPMLGRPHRIEHWTDARERAAIAVRDLLHGVAEPPDRAPYFWSDQYGTRIQFAGRRWGDEEITVEAGSPDGADVLAVYRRGEEPVAVLAMNQGKLFTRLRRQLARREPALAPTATAAASISPEENQ